MFFQVGQKFGNTAVSLSYHTAECFKGNVTAQNASTATCAKGSAFGGGAVHTLPKYNAEIYGGAHQYSATIGGTDADAILAVTFGSRIKF